MAHFAYEFVDETPTAGGFNPSNGSPNDPAGLAVFDAIFEQGLTLRKFLDAAFGSESSEIKEY